ncbi:MAG: insulinase family protein [Ruminococcus sp.]|nr:insulinase family protein [Ruminococcus sp.]MBO5164956.1 insulinase family protein [Ruminococcus sp.]
MRIKDKLHGFTVTNVRQSECGEFAEFSHDKTAARLVWLNNKEENKFFSISFKTIPEDDTGVFHILEHSVLGGSEKYPVKEPFLYLLKGSMNTFLNAMTFSDKTMFPVSSRNNTDFMNLVKVYLDAVFKPMIYSKPEIFYQEGHHIEFFGDEREAIYKGVVFNEMKGCLSNVHDRIESEMNSMLFPDTSYRFEYGGLPSAIPELDYEQFINAHKKFYHPSNSYIYLDGDIDLNEVLPLIDSYLSEYEKCGVLPEIKRQMPIGSCFRELYYDSSSEEESGQAQTFLAVGKILASWEEREKITAYTVLTEAVAGCNDSPLKKAVLDTGKCVDVSLGISDGILQPYGVLKFSNIARENGTELIAAAENAARTLVENGIGREILEAALNRCEFRFRESEEPKGLVRCIDSMSSWLYGGDPLQYIDMSDVFASLREKLDSGYFEELLSEWLLNKSGRAELYMLPSDSYGEELDRKERERIRSELSAMSENEKNELIKLNKELADWQNTPDTPEAAETIPKLSLNEVSREPIEFKTEISAEKGIVTLKHPARDKEIISLSLYFAADDLTKDELKRLSVLERLIVELPTEKSTGIELQNRVIGTLGSLSTNLDAFGSYETPETCRVFFTMKSRFLSRNTESALELIGELLTETVYEYPELARRLLKQDEEELKQDIISDGYRFAVRRSAAVMSAESAFSEYIAGFESYKILHDVNKLTDDEFSEFLGSLKELAERIFCKARLTVSVASAAEVSVDTLINVLPDGEKPSAECMRFSLEVPKEQGIVIPSATSHSGAVISEPIEDKAVWGVLSTILSYEYLWNEVRVKGGAYGSGCNVSSLNEVKLHSYCDPSPEESIGIYEKAADFLKEYCSGSPDISSYIISSIASGEPLMSDSEYASNADIAYFRGVTHECRRKLRRDMLEMTPEKLMTAYAELQKSLNCCIIGSKEVVSSVKSRELIVESMY